MNNILKEIIDIFSNASPVVFPVLMVAAALINVASWAIVRKLHKSSSIEERQRLLANTRLLQTMGEYLANQGDHDMHSVVTDHQRVM